ncbi:hypothetical protein GJ496_011169 [Pomphorhynchus laevis]|nr:hypothetical protein GJ496_011169 [Pomphorhynchus laevis]
MKRLVTVKLHLKGECNHNDLLCQYEERFVLMKQSISSQSIVDFARTCYELGKSCKCKQWSAYTSQGLSAVKYAINQQLPGYQQCYKLYAFLLNDWISSKCGLLHKLRNSRRIKKYLNKAYDCNPYDIELLKYIGDWNRDNMPRLYLKHFYKWLVPTYCQGNHDEAVQCYLTICKLCPSLDSHLTLTECLLNAGLFESAQKQMRLVKQDYGYPSNISAEDKERIETIDKDIEKKARVFYSL